MVNRLVLMRWTLGILGIGLWGCGCGSGDENPATAAGIPAAPCNPLGSGDCLTPFPSMVFLAKDAATSTGWRVSLSPDVLPKNNDGVETDPAFWTRLDGFSPAGYMLAYFPKSIDGSLLPPIDDIARSLEASCPIAVVDVATGTRVPHFAELDANAEEDGGRQGLIIRPVVRLEPDTRYAVGLHRSLGPERPAGFAAILDDVTSDNEVLESLRPSYEEIFAALEKAGMAKDDLLLAWDFHTSSDEIYLDPMKTMVDAALDAVPEMNYTVDSVTPGSGNPLRTITGTFDVPNFIREDGFVSDPPVADGVFTAPFTVVIPQAAGDAPLPVLIFGHGIFGTGREYLLGTFTRDLLAAQADRLGVVVVATDWVGLSTEDRPKVIAGVTDANLIHIPPALLRQSVANTAALGRLARDRFSSDANFMDGPTPLISGDGDIRYWGISLGGLMGQTLTAHDPDIERAALGVAGGNWGMLIQRSSNWPEFRQTIIQWYPDVLDELKLLLLWQSHFDFSDSITVAPRLLTDPPSGGDKRLVIIEALCDSQVANVATETVARTMGLPLTNPTLEPIPFGLEPRDGPLPAALTRYDLGLLPCPSQGNAPVSIDNLTHACVNIRAAALDQVHELLVTGTVGNQCDGACDCGPCNAAICGCGGACD